MTNTIKDSWEHEFAENIFSKGKEFHRKMIAAADYMDMRELLFLLSTKYVVNYKLDLDILNYCIDERCLWGLSVLIELYDDEQVYKFYTKLLDDLYEHIYHDTIKLLQFDEAALKLSHNAIKRYMEYLSQIHMIRNNMKRIYDYWIDKLLQLIVSEYPNTSMTSNDDDEEEYDDDEDEDDVKIDMGIIRKVNELAEKMTNEFGPFYRMERIIVSGYHRQFQTETDSLFPDEIVNLIQSML